MTKFFATRDNNGYHIAERADIVAFDSEAEAIEYLRSPYTRANGWNPDSVVIEAGDFGDCWIKTSSPNLADVEPFECDDLIFQGPGQHPGLSGVTWITPIPPVLIVSHVD